MNRSFMELIGARKKVILLCTLAGLLIGVVVEIMTPKLYEARLTIEVKPWRTSGTSCHFGTPVPPKSFLQQANDSVTEWFLDQKKSMGF